LQQGGKFALLPNKERRNPEYLSLSENRCENLKGKKLFITSVLPFKGIDEPY